MSDQNVVAIGGVDELHFHINGACLLFHIEDVRSDAPHSTGKYPSAERIE